MLLVVPVGLVVGAALLRRERADDSLRDVVAGVPEVLGEGVLEVLVVVERRLLGDLDVDAGQLGLLHEQVGRRRRDRADVVAREQLDLEALLARFAEQRLGLVDVLLALGQVAGVGHVERCVHVVAERAVAAQRLVDHLLAVDDQPHRLAHLDVVERRLVDAHGERHPGARLGDQDAAAGPLDGVDEVVGQVVDRLDLARLQRVDHGAGVREVLDLQLVDEGRVAPVVGVLGEGAGLAGVEGLVGEGAGAHGVRDVEVGRDDADGVLRQQPVEDRVGHLQHQLERGRVDHLRGLEVEDLGELTAPGERRLRVGDALDAEPGVLGGDVLAVVERHSLAHLDGPLGAVGRRLDGLGERRLELVVVVPEEQRLEEVAHPRNVQGGHRRVRVEGVLAAAAGGAVDQDAAGALRPAAAASAVVVASAGGQEAAARDGSGAEAGVLEQLAAGEPGFRCVAGSLRDSSVALCEHRVCDLGNIKASDARGQ